jgi:hypothetical protein
MNPLYARTNQYRGINAHLHSAFQSDDGWRGFHGTHITHLATALQDLLIPLGYIAQPEEGLQVRRVGEEPRTGRRYADIAVVDTQPESRFPVAVAGEVMIPLPQLITLDDDPDDTYPAIAIHRLEGRGDRLGPIVAWMELLSPGNKPGGGDFNSYRDKRRSLLQAGIVYIELDYLHASPPTLEGLPSYQPRQRGAAREPGSHPYHLLVIDPRPKWKEGEGRWVGFDVDVPIPSLTLPLAGADRIHVDFNAPYQRSFFDMAYGTRVDYASLPSGFDLYSPDDQARIVSRMLAALRAAPNLEQPPQLIDCLPLDEGLRALEPFQT